MKKILPFLLMAFVGLFAYSCDDKDDVVVQGQDNDTFSRMKDVTGSFTSTNTYAFTQGISIQNTDVVLVYRWAGNAWQQIPKTVHLANSGTMPTGRVFDYNFVFDSQNVQIRIDDQNFNLSTEITSTEISQYLNQQKFRIVLVPADPAGKKASVDYADYNAVVKYYNLNESKVVNTKAN
jgi:hypothetical protein